MQEDPRLLVAILVALSDRILIYSKGCGIFGRKKYPKAVVSREFGIDKSGYLDQTPLRLTLGMQRQKR